MARQFHRPARLDPEAAEQIEGSTDTAVASELAHRAAQALIGGFPGTETEDDPITRSGVVAAVAANGIDDIAELWADSPATTLPGTLWRLFLVREWIRRDPELVARRYATVVDLTEVHDRLPGHRAGGRLRPGGGVVGLRVLGAHGSVGAHHLDLQAVGAQGLDLLLAPLDQGDGPFQGGVQVEGVDLLQGGDPVGVNVNEVGTVRE